MGFLRRNLNLIVFSGLALVLIAITLLVFLKFAGFDLSKKKSPQETTQSSQSAKPIDETNHPDPPTPTPPPTPAPSPSPAPTPTPTGTPTEISRGDTSKNQIIFTFDGGSGSNSLQSILAALRKHGVIATFFLTGQWVQTYPNLTVQIANDNNEIFNHTYTHPDLTKVSDETIRDELARTEKIITSMVPGTTKPYFRPPYGARNQHVLDVAWNEGYRSVYWTVDALDWKESSGFTAEQVKQRIYSNLKPGAIILMHIGDNITGQILDEVLTKVKNDGYKIVPLTEGL